MKKLICMFFVACFASHLNAGALDLEMTGPEYLKYLESNKELGARASAPINKIISIGKRNLDWFKLINANRPANQQLALYSPELQTGIPIESPKAYNEQTVLADYEALKSQLPAEFSSVVFSEVELPTTHPLATDLEYLDWTRKLDRVYQSASRWSIMEPNLWYLADRSYGDIRGYYFLSKVVDLPVKLQAWSTLSDTEKSDYYFWLSLLCHNSRIEKSVCRTELDREIASGRVLAFYSKYLPASQSKYESYFKIQNPRSDVVWNEQDPFLTMIPFFRPDSLEVQKWLVDNIEDEWRWGDWQLRLNFVESNLGTTYVSFVPGATPNVNGLGGNRITMDANAPLQDYGSRWTIRHEYGHTLGLPDCYIEFYDTDKEIIVNYQIDLNNLMCSRKGRIQEIHVEELKRNYFQ